MKLIFQFAALLFPLLLVYSQEEADELLDGKTKVYLETNVNFATSAEDTRSDAQAGFGTLGLKFQRNDLMYGGVRFTVFSRNDSIQATTNTDNKIFGSNLLIPSNSSNSLSNFSIYLGTKSFYKLDSIDPNRSLFDWSRFGFYAEYSLNNTTWEINQTSLATNISSLSINGTYRLLTLKFDEVENGDAVLNLNFGYTNRRLSGDYALESNSELRNTFLNTDKLNFAGYNIGVRLEVSNFFGQFDFTRFKDEGIPGFSGGQAVITIGFNANLNLSAKENIATR
jgi:hypothetical protein